MLVVLDTNVVVSGLLNGTGFPGRIMDLALDGHFQVAYDDRILGEYEDVLARPELRINPARAREVIAFIELNGCHTEAAPFLLDEFADPDDLPFVEVFITANAQALVTGNIKHFLALITQGMAIHTPASFMQKFFPNE